MKINDYLLGTFNAKFEDLMFEVGVLGRLEDYQTRAELENYFDEKFPSEYSYDEEGERIEVESESTKLQQAFKRALKEIGVADRDELLAFLSNKLKTPLNDLDDVKEVVNQVKDDLTNVLQLDRVTESLVKFGATEATLVDIEKIKTETLTRLMGQLDIKLTEVVNGDV